MNWATAFGAMVALLVSWVAFAEEFDQLPAAAVALAASWWVLRLGEEQAHESVPDRIS